VEVGEEGEQAARSKGRARRRSLGFMVRWVLRVRAGCNFKYLLDAV